MSEHSETIAPAGPPVEAPSGEPSASLGPNYRKVFTASVISNLGDGVSQIGYPWLASAVTRNPFLIALVAVAQRLPWLIFTLPAGVITDRVDRRKLMVRMDIIRGFVTAGVAVAILGLGTGLPSPDDLDKVVGTRSGLYLLLLFAALLLGCAEVLRDNSAQTILPSIVRTDQLEKANGRMWSAEMVANTFVGPPLGSLLLSVSFFLPFALDSVSFFAAAGLVFLLMGQFRAKPVPGSEGVARPKWTVELKEGVRWLWHHELLRTLAITLGVLNAISSMEFGTLILFGQEVLHTKPLEFAVLTMGAAIGGVVGGWTAPWVTKKLGSGPSLWLTLVATALTPIPIGLTSWWPLVFLMFGLGTLVGVVWNVITVSLRQTIIPDHLLGRVNSVYRFFGWGMMPIGTAFGGIVVVVAQHFTDRRTALRMPWFVAGGIGLLLMIYAIPRLTTEKIETARVGGTVA
jgi:MFS family permease